MPNRYSGLPRGSRERTSWRREGSEGERGDVTSRPAQAPWCSRDQDLCQPPQHWKGHLISKHQKLFPGMEFHCAPPSLGRARCPQPSPGGRPTSGIGGPCRALPRECGSSRGRAQSKPPRASTNATPSELSCACPAGPAGRQHGLCPSCTCWITSRAWPRGSANTDSSVRRSLATKLKQPTSHHSQLPCHCSQIPLLIAKDGPVTQASQGRLERAPGIRVGQCTRTAAYSPADTARRGRGPEP